MLSAARDAETPRRGEEGVPSGITDRRRRHNRLSSGSHPYCCEAKARAKQIMLGTPYAMGSQWLKSRPGPLGTCDAKNREGVDHFAGNGFTFKPSKP